MPKRQSTAAKAARAAARKGVKYTSALRQEHAERERRRGRSRRLGDAWSMGFHPLLDLANSPAMQIANSPAMRAALNSPAMQIANSPAMRAAQDLAIKIAFPFGGPASRGRGDSSPG